MNKIKNNLPIILVSLSSILFVVAILLLVNANVFKSNNKVNSNGTNSNDVKEIKKDENNGTVKDTIESDISETEIITPTPTSVPTSVPTPTIVPTATPVPTATSIPTATPVPTTAPVQEVVTEDEESIINYFQAKENEIKAGDEKTFGEKAKEGFINVVDFIFYDKEIKGHTFKELTNTAKLKIISIALKIDNKIDSYFPNYKDKIKGTYTNIKAKLVEKYLEYSQKLCEKVGEQTCNQAKADWEALKNSFGITGEYLKNLGLTGKDKIKNWYENFRDNN